jgi:GNAT superfamily N-acetyltransferase
MAVKMRDAGQADGRFLAEMLLEAVNWNRSIQRPRVELLADRKVMRYVSGWQRPSDFGSVALDNEGEPIGACWARLFPPSEPGYGFVAVGVPELTLGMRPPWRAQGIGRLLLQRVMAQARTAGHARLGLSVSRGNYAQKLYRSEGFSILSSDATADVMVRTLR